MAVERDNSNSGTEPLNNNPNGLPAQGTSVAGEQAIDKQYLAAPVKSAVDKFQLIPEFLKVRGLVKQHLDSFNYFVNIGIKKIIRANERIELRNGEHYLRFKDIWIGEPSMPVDGIDRELTPQQCRLSDLTYSAPIFVNIEYTVESSGQVVKKDKKKVMIGRMPVMLRSCCCVLSGKDEAELAKLGECPLDPGGYFVVKGAEKVLFIQEQLSKNRIIIETDKKRRVNASVQSSTDKLQSKTALIMDKEKIYLHLNKFKQMIPIMVFMKAMGMESDQEVVQMIGRDPRYSDLLLPSIEECATLNIFTQQQALDFLDGKLARPKFADAPPETAITTLRDVFIALVPVHQQNLRPKCLYTAVMMRRMMEAILNKDTIDDKCFCLGVEDLELLSGEELHKQSSFLIMFNGLILGKHRRPQNFATALRKLRRTGKISEFVSVFVNEKQHCIYIASDGGRVCRPLVIVENEKPKVQEHHMQELLDGVRNFDDFLRDGLVEYLDVNEQNNALIALYDGDVTKETTHVEIEPFTILGVCAGLIPYPHHNQSPRNMYQCAMGKQAMGNIAFNQLCRMVTLLYLLVYPQRPLLTTKTIELVGYDKLGAGQNATVAVMSYSGYDIEDAIVMNKSSLD